MSIRNINAYQTRVHQIVFGFFFVAAVAVAIRSLMFGSYSRALLIVSAFMGIALIIGLQQRYWLLLPFMTTSNFSIPGLPFDGKELGCLILIGTYCVRLALKQEHSFRFGHDLIVALPAIGWIFLVWMLNPVGLATFGSSTIGGRFYFNIVIGTLTLFALSSIRVSETDAKFLFFVLLIGMIWSLLRNLFFPGYDPDSIVFGIAGLEPSTRYGFIVCASIFMLLFSYWSLSSVLFSPARVLLFVALSILVVYSGKRRAFGAIALVPFFRMFLTGKERFLTLVVSVFAGILLLFAVAGDGGAYQIPQSARRALAVVVPEYKRYDDGGLVDVFRQEMREQARVVVRDNPWFGRKGFAMSFSETAWINFGGGSTSLYAGHAYAGNWHSTWYAYAADFGIPCMVFWFLFTAYVLVYVFRACRVVTIGRFLPACCLYFSLWFFVDTVFSYTTGHASFTTRDNFVSYGMLLAIVRGYKMEQGLSET